jgi:hypothetical protein
MSTTKAKTPTTRGISALLRKAGFEKSVSSTTRIRGWHNHSEGFTVEDRGADKVRVRHTTGKFKPSDADRAWSRKQEGEYAETIREAGYAVDRDEWGTLLVTAQPVTAPSGAEEGQ